MKSSLISRFEPALQVLLNALSEPLDFRKLTLLFDHGSRKLAGQILAADADASTFRYQLPGRSGTAEAEEIIGLLRDYCALYDSCRVELYQRGQNRFFEAGDRGVRMGSLPALADDGQPSSAETTRNNKIKINEAAVLLQAIGIIDANGRLRNDKIRKYNQIDRFVELAEPLLKELAAESSTLHIYDLACGKSYLSFVLNYYVREKLQIPCHVHGIDISEGVVTSSRQLAEQLGYRNMIFEQGDLRAFRPTGQVDLCISLHACDIATDFALAASINARSRAIIAVPCCQRELLAGGFNMPESLTSLTSHGVLKARLADLLTDSLRLLLLKAAGYETSLIEYISPLDTPKNLMLRARHTGRHDQSAIQEYRALARQLGNTITLGKIMEDTDYGCHSGYEELR
ncbi:MAG TPA: SAM-dependent methyltransferase [Clostridiales bacterium]|nr:SAM-dependent methyltransferase [Clostridiales bacterium]